MNWNKWQQKVGRTVLFIVIMMGLFGGQLMAQTEGDKRESKGKEKSSSPYELRVNLDLILGGAALTTAAAATILDFSMDPMTTAEIAALDAQNINGLDRHVTENWDPAARTASDYVLYGSGALVGTLLLSRKMRQNFGTITVMGLEAVLLNHGMTFLTKTLTRRVRPFLYNPDVPLSEKGDRGARQSFYSGHSSYSAVACFFTAKVIHDYFPDAKWRRWMWVGAALVPATSAYLRVRAGKHYITDVVVGYLMGAATGFVVPHLHRRKLAENLNFSLGLGGFNLSYRF
ncbi:MAG: phosphatase PAP2 family protein [Bacteroidota bacterium]